MLRFIARQMRTKEFWWLFAATFTLILMAEWKKALMDVFFRRACRAIGRMAL
jgi:hypothetical protein